MYFDNVKRSLVVRARLALSLNGDDFGAGGSSLNASICKSRVFL